MIAAQQGHDAPSQSAGRELADALQAGQSTASDAHQLDNSHQLEAEVSLPTRPIIPITATLLDISALDDYLVNLLTLRFTKDNNLVDYNQAWHIALIKFFTIIYTQGQTPAARILGLRFSSFTHDLLRFRLVAYAAIKALLPFLMAQLRVLYHRHVQYTHAITRRGSLVTATRAGVVVHEYEYDEYDNDYIDEVARQRQIKVIQALLDAYDRMVPVIRVSALLLCWTGLSATVDPAMIYTGFFYQYYSKPPKLHVEYAYRRWLLQKGMEAARVLLGGLAIQSVWKRDKERIKNVIDRWMYSRWLMPLRLLQRRLPESTCPVCKADSILVPYVTDCCGHCYCYTCLSSIMTRVADSSRPYCRVCGQYIRSIQPQRTQQARVEQ
jgi:hypothetical protein